MAQAIFKEWFVDFGPFRDGGMQDSELGPIPLGWKVGSLGELLDNIKEPVKAGPHLQGLRYVPIDMIPIKKFCLYESQSWENAQSSLIKFSEDDILLGAMRVYFHRVVVAPFAGVTRTTCFVLRPKINDDLAYASMLIFQENTIRFAESHSKGSTMPYAVWDNSLEKLMTVIPPAEVRSEYSNWFLPMIQKIKNSYFEINNLQEIRDTLLPKLMSGELRVPVSDNAG